MCGVLGSLMCGVVGRGMGGWWVEVWVGGG
jgi:hypothetical protein